MLVMFIGNNENDTKVSKTPAGMEMRLKRVRISSKVRLPDMIIAPKFIKRSIIKVGASKNPTTILLKLIFDITAIKIKAKINNASPANNFAKIFFLEISFSRIISTKLVSAFFR